MWTTERALPASLSPTVVNGIYARWEKLVLHGRNLFHQSSAALVQEMSFWQSNNGTTQNNYKWSHFQIAVYCHQGPISLHVSLWLSQCQGELCSWPVARLLGSDSFLHYSDPEGFFWLKVKNTSYYGLKGNINRKPIIHAYQLPI